MLLTVRRTSTYFLFLLVFAAAPSLYARVEMTQATTPTTPVQVPPQSPAQAPQTDTQQPTQQSTQPSTQQSTQLATPSAPPRPTLAVVVLDAAHGGADPGAHGASGIQESDVVLSFARLLRISLEAQGLRVILTRPANDDPSFDDRSKLANAQRACIFITLHVSSTGQAGTVRTYSLPQQIVSSETVATPRAGLVPWDRAQFNFIDQSRRLAELIQIQMAQRFRGSPETPLTAPVRQLRTVAAPAVAIEVSSVSIADRALLDKMAPALADGVARAVAAFRTVYEPGSR
jgi:N-acetylmuramoyl-L-alanine amidase